MQVTAEGSLLQKGLCVVSREERREGPCSRTIKSCSVLASLSRGSNFCTGTSLRLPLNNKTSFRKSHGLPSPCVRQSEVHESSRNPGSARDGGRARVSCTPQLQQRPGTPIEVAAPWNGEVFANVVIHLSLLSNIFLVPWGSSPLWGCCAVPGCAHDARGDSFLQGLRWPSVKKGISTSRKVPSYLSR